MKQFLELVPDVREIISDFYHSRYSSCLALMEKIRGDLMLDMYMNAHVEKLYGMIRSKALIQYFTPFASVQMEMMSQAFSTTVPELQKELTELIMKKDIKARIDSHNKIIYARQADQEVITCQWAFVLCVDCLARASTSHLAASSYHTNGLCCGLGLRFWTRGLRLESDAMSSCHCQPLNTGVDLPQGAADRARVRAANKGAAAAARSHPQRHVHQGQPGPPWSFPGRPR